MKIEIRGNYLISDLVPVFQHLVAQLEDFGVGAVEGVMVSLDARRAGGTPLSLADEAGPASHLLLEIGDLARPCAGTGKLRVIETPAPRRSSPGAPHPKSRRSYRAD